MVHRRRPPSQTWRTFLENQVKTMVSVDFFTVLTIWFQVLYVSLVLAHDRRCIVHFNVTAHPTAEWTAQQLREAFPFDQVPRSPWERSLRGTGDWLHPARVLGPYHRVRGSFAVSARAGNTIINRALTSRWRRMHRRRGPSRGRKAGASLPFLNSATFIMLLTTGGPA